MNATVKWFNDVKGFGFLIPDDGKGDVFVHQTAILSEGHRTLTEGQQVTCDVEMGSKGRNAKNVMVSG